MKKHLITVAAALILGGCQLGSSVWVRDVAHVDRFTQFEGASLVLKQDLNVPAERARLFLQNGRVSSGFDSYQPHCAFEIDSVRHDGFPIPAGTFSITLVQSSIERVVSISPVRVAALQLASGMAGGGSQSYYQGYHFWLTSADHPQVRRMSCYGVYAQPYELYPPTVAEIRQVLGDIAEIRQ